MFIGNSVFIIAEVAQAHDGSLGIAHSYIDALASAGVNAVKFQIHIASAESSEHECFRVKFSFQDKTRQAYWRRMEFTPEQWVGLKAHCDEKGVVFMASVFSMEAFDLAESLGVRLHKVASGEIENYLLLRAMARTGKDILLSSGMSAMDDVAAALEFIGPFGCRTALMQCSTSYPTPPERWGLNVLAEFRRAFQIPVGLSDHSGSIVPCLAATACGAEILEAHAVFDRRMFGPDASSSLTIDEFKSLVDGVRSLEFACSHPVDKSDACAFAGLRATFGKSLAMRRAVEVGHILAEEDLETKKPAGHGLPPKLFMEILGRRTRKVMAKGEFLNRDNLD